MLRRLHSRLGSASLALALPALLAACERAPRYQVWAADQNGDTLYVLSPDGEVVSAVDLGGAAGAERVHMLVGLPGHPFVYSANTVSNSVTVLRRADAGVEAVIPSVGKAPHAAQPHPDGRRIYVSNIAPQATDAATGRPDRGETITEIARGADGGWAVSRTLDLKADPALADTAQFPNRRPVCGGFSKDGRYLLVTFFSGGAASVDLDAWRVGRAWGKERIAPNGCGAVASPDGSELYVTSGSMETSHLYVFDVSAEPELVAARDLSGVGRDAHGAALDPGRNELWIVYRVTSNASIHPLATIRDPEAEVEVVDFVGRTPDLVEIAPDGRRAYVTLRGPNPAPTIPHPTVGERPGVSILDVATRTVIETVHPADAENGDFHGIVIPRS